MSDMRLAGDGSHPSRLAIPDVRIVVGIDKGIPMPPMPRTRGRPPGRNAVICPWHRMDVGDSFIFPFGNSRDGTSWLMSAFSAVGARNKRSSLKFTVRVVDDVPRVWRTA